MSMDFTIISDNLFLVCLKTSMNVIRCRVKMAVSASMASTLIPANVQGDLQEQTVEQVSAFVLTELF